MNRVTFNVVFFVHLLLAIPAARAFNPPHVWSQRFGSSGIDVGRSVAVDGSGNVLVTGYVDGPVDFGGGLLASAGDEDIFVAKFNSDGAHQWSQRFGSSGEDIAYSVAADASGSVVVTGEFGGSVDFGGGSLASAGSSDIFLAKYDPNGNHQWSRRFGDTGSDVAYSLTLDGSGDVVLTGEFHGSVDFGGGSLASAGTSDIFLAKYDANGNHQWSRRFGGASIDVGRAVSVNGSGGVAVTGEFRDAVDFGGGSLASAGANDIFLAKYDSNGNHQWSRRFGGVGEDVGHAVGQGDSENAFVTGVFSATVDFGGGNLVSSGSLDVFLASYDPDGIHTWSRRFGGTAVDGALDVAVDGSGNVLVTGTCQGTVDFGGGNLVGAGSWDLFLAEYDADGVHQWSQRLGGTGIDQGGSIESDGTGNFFVTGAFEDIVDFGGGNMVSAGLPDLFLAKYSDVTAEPLITSIVDVGNDQGRRVRINFLRSGHDNSGTTTPIVRYEAYLRDDPAPPTGFGPISAEFPRAPFTDGWVLVASVSAHGEEVYLMDAPTDADSTDALGVYYSVFFIRAVTEIPSVFCDSPVDSGYSVDNLSPGVPGSLLYDDGILTWSESAAADFKHFSIYGANIDDYGAATLIDYTTMPSLDVTGSPYVFYFITASDFSGNEGDPGRINTASGAGETPASYVLSVSNSPNPFNPRTTVSYAVPSRGPVTVAIYDARGALVATLVSEEDREAGVYSTGWSGLTVAGTAASSGVYFARIEHNGVTRTRKMVMLK